MGKRVGRHALVFVQEVSLDRRDANRMDNAFGNTRVAEETGGDFAAAP